jgi:hypothetical protein
MVANIIGEEAWKETVPDWEMPPVN